MEPSDQDWPRCACGCGEPVPVRKANCAARGFVKGEPCKFVADHSSRTRIVPVADGLKRCPSCGLPKPIAGFARSAGRPTGFDVYCRDCMAAQARARYLKRNGPPKYRRWPSNAIRTRAGAAARRARKRDQFVEHVDASVVYNRDEGVCGICTEPVESDNFHVDHIIPLVRGGEHCYANVQVAHPSCNVSKKDRVA